jgi:hypothetical protein
VPEREYVGYTQERSGSVTVTPCGVPAIEESEYIYVGQEDVPLESEYVYVGQDSVAPVSEYVYVGQDSVVPEREYVGYTQERSGSVTVTPCGVPAIEESEYVGYTQD